MKKSDLRRVQSRSKYNIPTFCSNWYFIRYNFTQFHSTFILFLNDDFRQKFNLSFLKPTKIFMVLILRLEITQATIYPVYHAQHSQINQYFYFVYQKQICRQTPLPENVAYFGTIGSGQRRYSDSEILVPQYNITFRSEARFLNILLTTRIC